MFYASPSSPSWVVIIPPPAVLWSEQLMRRRRGGTSFARMRELKNSRTAFGPLEYGLFIILSLSGFLPSYGSVFWFLMHISWFSAHVLRSPGQHLSSPGMSRGGAGGCGYTGRIPSSRRASVPVQAHPTFSMLGHPSEGGPRTSSFTTTTYVCT